MDAPEVRGGDPVRPGCSRPERSAAAKPENQKKAEDRVQVHRIGPKAGPLGRAEIRRDPPLWNIRPVKKGNGVSALFSPGPGAYSFASVGKELQNVQTLKKRRQAICLHATGAAIFWPVSAG